MSIRVYFTHLTENVLPPMTDQPDPPGQPDCPQPAPDDNPPQRITKNLSIWPMGYDVVITVLGEQEAAGAIFILAVADGASTPKEALEKSSELDGPGAMLYFKDEQAVDHFIERLKELREVIRLTPDRPAHPFLNEDRANRTS